MFCPSSAKKAFQTSSSGQMVPPIQKVSLAKIVSKFQNLKFALQIRPEFKSWDNFTVAFFFKELQYWYAEKWWFIIFKKYIHAQKIYIMNDHQLSWENELEISSITFSNRKQAQKFPNPIPCMLFMNIPIDL